VRIVHTSDWHIGRKFERESLEGDQRRFVGWLAEEVARLGVDLVVVAGDVYDRSLPAEDAVSTLDAGLDALRAAGATVAMIPGNHDSARRLGFGARRQALGGVHVFADDGHPPEPWLFEAGGEAVAIVAVPYLDPLVTAAPRPAADGSARLRTHENVLADALSAGRDAVERPGVFARAPRIAVAHATVAGSSPSDSEKQLAIGGAEAVDARVFAGFDYVALGHLHRPQHVSEDGRIAYSGSPLPYSFSEDHRKSVRLVEIARGAVVSVSEIPIPVGRPVVTLEGPLEELLDDPVHDAYVEHWVAARLTDTTTQVQPLERLRRRFPYAVHVRYARSAQLPARFPAPGVSASAGERPVEDVVADFLAELQGRPPDGWARELVLEAVEAAHRAGEQQ
jgi:DNA repair protein SbcD/Mre11